jgi:hypothetical protein
MIELSVMKPLKICSGNFSWLLRAVFTYAICEMEKLPFSAQGTILPQDRNSLTGREQARRVPEAEQLVTASVHHDTQRLSASVNAFLNQSSSAV